MNINYTATSITPQNFPKQHAFHMYPISSPPQKNARAPWIIMDKARTRTLPQKNHNSALTEKRTEISNSQIHSQWLIRTNNKYWILCVGDFDTAQVVIQKRSLRESVLNIHTFTVFKEMCLFVDRCVDKWMRRSVDRYLYKADREVGM